MRNNDITFPDVGILRNSSLLFMHERMAFMLGVVLTYVHFFYHQPKGSKP
jgi:hypothetical protein